MKKKELVVPIISEVRINAYSVISEAVERGTAYGVHRAYKHTNKPSHDAIAEAVRDAVMSELCEVLLFE